MSDPARAPLRVSVIVPAWNDHVSLARLLPTLVRLKGLHEVIVADASPHSATAKPARTVGVIYLAAPQPNRGAQMNLAAENASGDVLLFHHADSILTSAHVAAIERALQDPETIGGAFYRKFDGRHPRLRSLEAAGRFFTRHGGSFFGDQSIFVRRETFRAVGGFAPIPLMEDMEFSRRLRRAGRTAVLDPPVNRPPGGMRAVAHGAPRSRTDSSSCSTSADFRRAIYIAGIILRNRPCLTASASLQPEFPFGNLIWGDFDGNGDLDIFVDNHYSKAPYLNLNNGDGTFTDIFTSTGIKGIRDRRGSGWCDFDNDDDLDVPIGTWGERRGDPGA